jgi:thioesterase domain-containing protein/acyl carrier protein
MPLFHIHGIVGAVLSSLYAGASVVCCPGFQGRWFFQWLQEFQPTWYTAGPAVHAAILARATQNEDVLKRHSLRFIRSCSAALPNAVLRDLEQRFGIPVLEAYGMTEAAHQIACNPLPPATRKPGSVGVATGVEIAIFDEEGRTLGPDCEGEIVIRGGSVITSYVDNASTDRRSFLGDWLCTGDIGSIDHDGYVFIKGRAKELINRGGTKIAPREIEEVFLEHTNVVEAVAFAMPERRVGEEVAAAVVLRHPSVAAATELREFVSSRLSDFKVPRQLVFLNEIPKGPTGKPQRIGLADKLGLVATPRETHRGNVAMHQSRTQLEDLLTVMWTRVIGVERVGLSDNFFEIGGDSLAAIELIAGIEQVTGRKLTIAALFEAPTVQELAVFIERNDSEWPAYVVPIQFKGTREPFFCVGAGPRYQSLAWHLGTDQPFLGLLCPDVSPSSPALSFEAMAEFCAKSIRAMQPEGPYFVGGWCAEGLIAYEIAQQLQAQGQIVALLVLFDAVNPGRLDKLSATHRVFVQADENCRKIWFHLGSMTGLKFGAMPAYSLERLKAIYHTITRRTRLSRGVRKFVRPLLLYDLVNMAVMRYRPKTYSGRVLLFRRSLRPISKYLDETLGWGGLIAGELNVVEIRGGHSDMLCEPQVQDTAAKLAAYLRAAVPSRKAASYGDRGQGVMRS